MNNFVLVDDWYQLEEKAFRGKVPGAKAIMNDSEILTLALMMDYLPLLELEARGKVEDV